MALETEVHRVKRARRGVLQAPERAKGNRKNIA
jgi:hypothetical protein